MSSSEKVKYSDNEIGSQGNSETSELSVVVEMAHT
jgi:hypothetical protein